VIKKKTIDFVWIIFREIKLKHRKGRRKRMRRSLRLWKNIKKLKNKISKL